jgi:hypothetical protein
MARYGREYHRGRRPDWRGHGRFGGPRDFGAGPAYGRDYGPRGAGRREPGDFWHGGGYDEGFRAGQGAYDEDFDAGRGIPFRGGYATDYYSREPSRPRPHETEDDMDGVRYDLEFSGRGWPYGVGYEGGVREDYSHRPASRRPDPTRGPSSDDDDDRAGGYRAGRDEMTELEEMRRQRHAGAGHGGHDGYGAEYEGPLRGRGHTPSSRWPDHESGGAAGRHGISDEDLREEVREALFHDTWIEPDRIELEVQDGVVTLKGEVRDFMEARYAWDDVWDTPGVRGVVNQLTVRPDGAAEDAGLPQTAGDEPPAEGEGGRA